MSNNEILEIYYPYIKKIATKKYEDIAQIVALDLLQKDNAKLNEMHINNQLNYFILKMLYNQKNFKSTYYRDFKDFQARSSVYNVNTYDEVDEGYYENNIKLEDLQFYTSKTEYQLISDWTKVNGKSKNMVYEKYNVNTIKFQRLLDRIRYRQRQYKQLKPVLHNFDINTQSAITQMMKVY